MSFRFIKLKKRDSIDTRKNKKVVADRMIQLLTYKDHFMIDMDEKLPITKYDIEHKDELDNKFSDVPITLSQLMKNNKGEKSDGSGLTTVFKTMFKCGYFREINQWEQKTLGTCEFDNNLNDYVDLSYNEELCYKEEHDDLKKISEWSLIYYADYNTDVTLSPYKPYLCCLCDDKNVVSFNTSYSTKEDDNDLTSRFLNSLKTNGNKKFAPIYKLEQQDNFNLEDTSITKF